MARQRIRRMFGQGLSLPRVEAGDRAAPVYPPLNIYPGAAPSGTGEEGDVYVNSTSHIPFVHNGTAFVPAGGLRVVKTAAATLTEADSGATLVFNNATGFTYTLPAAAEGLWFRIVFLTTVTSGNARVACASGDFFVGTVWQGTDTTYLPAARTANGTTHLAFEGNGTTTGGFNGDWFEAHAISGTQWLVHGLIAGSGAEATPWKTS